MQHHVPVCRARDCGPGTHRPFRRSPLGLLLTDNAGLLGQQQLQLVAWTAPHQSGRASIEVHPPYGGLLRDISDAIDSHARLFRQSLPLHPLHVLPVPGPALRFPTEPLHKIRLLRASGFDGASDNES